MIRRIIVQLSLLVSAVLVAVCGIFIRSTNLAGLAAMLSIVVFLAYGEHLDKAWIKLRVRVDNISAPECYALVQSLATNANTPRPKLVRWNSAPIAQTSGFRQRHSIISFNDTIQNLMSRSELEAIFAHEIAHIKRRDVFKKLVLAIMLFAALVLFAIAQLVIVVCSFPAIAIYVWFYVTRHLEYSADELGGRLIGDYCTMADALSKLAEWERQQDQRTGKITNMRYDCFASHPSYEDRIAVLRNRPPLK